MLSFSPGSPPGPEAAVQQVKGLTNIYQRLSSMQFKSLALPIKVSACRGHGLRPEGSLQFELVCGWGCRVYMACLFLEVVSVCALPNKSVQL